MKGYHLILFLLIQVISFAQEPFLADGKYGFRENGKTIITPSYEYATHFVEGIAVVKKNGKWGLIDKGNNFIITPQFDKMEIMKDGFAKVLLNGKYGLINSKGDLVLEPKFLSIEKYYSDSETYLFQDENNKYGFFKVGWEIVAPKYDEILIYNDIANCKLNGLYDTYNEQGLFLEKQKRTISVWSFEKDQTVIANKGDLYGIYHQKMGWVIEPLYKSIKTLKVSNYEEVDFDGEFKSFNHLYVLFSDELSEEVDWKSKVENSNIKIVKGGRLKEIATNITGYKRFKNNKEFDYEIDAEKGSFVLSQVLASKIEHKNYIIERLKTNDGSVVKILLEKSNLNDTLLIADEITYVENNGFNFSGTFFIYKSQKHYGIYHKNINIQTKYEKIEISDSHSYILILKNGDKMNLLNMTSGTYSRASYNYSKDLKIYRDEYFPNYYLYENEKMIGFDGRIYKEINQYYSVEGDKNNFYLVNYSNEIDEKDRKSSQTFSILRETEFPNVFIAKGDNKKYGIINHQLDTLVPFIYSNIEGYFPDYIMFQDYMFPHEYYYKVYEGKKVGIYNLHRGLLLEPIYTDIDQHYEEDYLIEYFKIFDKKLIGMANMSGEVILPPIYTSIISLNYYTFIHDGLLKVINKNGKAGIYTTNGKEILAPVYDALDEALDKAFEMNIFGATEFLHKIYKNNKEGFFSSKKGLLIPSQYDFVLDFYETEYNTYLVFKTQIGKNLFGIYDYHGNELFPCDFKEFQFYPEYATDKDTLIVSTKKEGKYYVNVNYIPKNTLAKHFSYDNYYNHVVGYYGIKIKGDTYEKYNLKTNQLTETFQKSDTITFEGYSFDIVLLNGKFGAMNKEGKITVPPIYDEGQFMDGRSEILIGYENGIKYYVYFETNEKYTEEEW